MSYIFRIAGFLVKNATKYRSLGVNDFVASLTSVALLVLSNLGFLFWIYRKDFGYDLTIIGGAIAIVAIFAAIAIPVVTYLINLRAFGITHADSKISAGIDYKSSLERLGSGGFKFMGVSGAKLTACDTNFRSVVQATGRGDGKIQMLIVDPSSANTLKDLEGRDSTFGYQERINGSSQFLNRVAQENSHTVEIRQYHAGTVADLKPFRLLFSSSDCLLSPFVKGTGVNDQGRNLPQICVSSKGWPNSGTPTFFSALNNYFLKSWEEAQPKNIIGEGKNE